ncbi:MAG: Carboxypeptidase T [Candidatus Ozemobacter sibiricus]|uniref:carboxypeptidase T n=1 Tax=Candidatus Ozemobacter sibiricus TaxID=2268124 RepID=A0A367ZLU0_9BACT|nr:MAG: Carboxypeptidase T [Candidatus Ozemobacter sibiricus]
MSRRPTPFFFWLFAVLLALAGSPVFAAKTLVRLEGLTPAQMQEYHRQGYDIARYGKDFLEVVLEVAEVRAFTKRGLRVTPVIPDLDRYIAEVRAAETAEAKYYTYQTMYETMQTWVEKYPKICRLESIGKTFENRDIWALKISDHPQVDEKEPAVLIMGAHHAREWISTEVPMATAKALLEGYGQDERLTRLVNEREIWFVPMVNPDGMTYSQTVNRYWRKNRRKNADGSFGVDPNRNYGYKWGVAGASTSPSADTYQGPSPFSELETQAIRDLAAREKFSADISFHSYSELILYPWSWTNKEKCEHDAIFAKFGKEMAAFNRYTSQQSSDLYPSGGDTDDYLYATHKSLSFTFELATTFIPTPDKIAPICAQNVPAVLHLIEKAGTYGLVTPVGEDLIADLDTPSAVAALVDLTPFASQNDVAARLRRLEVELARRLVADQAAGRTATAEALAQLPSDHPMRRAIERDAAQMLAFATVHRDTARP